MSVSVVFTKHEFRFKQEHCRYRKAHMVFVTFFQAESESRGKLIQELKEAVSVRDKEVERFKIKEKVIVHK